MRLDAELLDGPPAEGARVTVLARLADAGEAAARLADPADGEALHDLRVALRRLRSTLRALGPLLPCPVPEKQARRLRKAARLTGPARDAEVFLAWLGGPAARRCPARTAAPTSGWWSGWSAAARPRRAPPAAGRCGWPSGRWRRSTRRLVGAAVAPAPQPFALALAGLLRAQAVALREAVREVVGPEDVAAIHQVRIEGKRLRYLLEPLRGAPGADAAEAVAALKGLQELVGEWHDAQLFRQALARAQVEAAADRARWRSRGGGEADFKPGLLALDQVAATEAAGRYAALDEAHLRRKATPLLDLVYAVVAALEAGWGAAAPEDEDEGGPGEAAPPAPPERRLLLTGLPEGLDGATEEVRAGLAAGRRGPRELGRGPHRRRGAALPRPRPPAAGRRASSRPAGPTSRPSGRSPPAAASPSGATCRPAGRGGASTSSSTGSWCWR